MDSRDELTGPVNLGNPAEISILDLAQRIIALTGSKSPLVFKPLPSDDPTQRCPDIALARRELGWEPQTALEQGLIRTIAYFDELMGSAQVSGL
jgi:UDP-glucuronate decarboxylase